MNQSWVKHAIVAASPEGWDVSSDWTVSVAETGWVVASKQDELGDFRFRLAEDQRTLIFIHSTDIHRFPPPIEEATLIRLDGFRNAAGLSHVLRDLMATRKPNHVHEV